jgi:parallel beta-helix repeat protein
VIAAGTAFLQKPFSDAELAHKVREVLDRLSLTRRVSGPLAAWSIVVARGHRSLGREDSGMTRFTKTRIRLGLLGMAAAAVMISAGPSQASAAPTLTISTDTTLTADYEGQILVAGEGTTLDCGGHAVRGEGAGVGINVQADRVTVTGCLVQGFDVGILTGRDATRIRENAASGNDQGIVLAGATSGEASGNVANNNRSWGIIASQGATGNVIDCNSANNNGLIGLALNTAAANVVTRNVANRNGGAGFDVLLSSANEILNNVAANNGNAGFAFQRSSSNTLVGNLATNNGTPGNGSGFAFNDSSGNFVSANVARHNGGVGFFTFFVSELNVFTMNRGCHNFFVDAADISTGAGNTWSDNDFCTSEVIQTSG